MQLTRFTDYALRALMYLGLHRDRTVTIAEVAQTFRISENHMMKIVHQLGQRGYVETVRGKGGGMRLARAADKICIGALVREIEELNIAECFDPANRACALLPACKLKSALHEAGQAFLKTLDGYCLADFLPKPGSAQAQAMRTRLAG